MDRQDVEERIRRVVTNTTSIPGDRIGATTSFRKELGLDSLTLIEVGVDVSHEFKIRAAEEKWDGLDSVSAVADFVQRELANAGAPAASSG